MLHIILNERKLNKSNYVQRIVPFSFTCMVILDKLIATYSLPMKIFAYQKKNFGAGKTPSLQQHMMVGTSLHSASQEALGGSATTCKINAGWNIFWSWQVRWKLNLRRGTITFTYFSPLGNMKETWPFFMFQLILKLMGHISSCFLYIYRVLWIWCA